MTKRGSSRPKVDPFGVLSLQKLKDLSDLEFLQAKQAVQSRALRRFGHSGYAKSLGRSLLLERKRATGTEVEHGQFHPLLLLARMKQNEMLDALVPNREPNWVNPARRVSRSQLTLESFTFFDQPNQTFSCLRIIAESECVDKHLKLDFADEKIQGLGPYVLLGIMRQGMAPMGVGGHMSESVQKVLESVGLRKFLGMAEFEDIKDDDGNNDLTDVWSFPLRNRYSSPGTEKRMDFAVTKVVDDLVEKIDEWLGCLPVAQMLSTTGRTKLNRIASEVLENARRHGKVDEDCDWYVAGFMARRNRDADDPQDIRYDCYLTFVNFGRPIYETIADARPKVIKDLEAYIELHKRRCSQNVLATLYALQDDVSCREDPFCGKGTMDLVEFTNDLAQDKDPKYGQNITIISGNACIQLKEKFKNCCEEQDGARVQPLNDSEEFTVPPDPNFAFELDFTFPGTIIDIRFSLDQVVPEDDATY